MPYPPNFPWSGSHCYLSPPLDTPLNENLRRIGTGAKFRRWLTYTGKPSLNGDVGQNLPPIRVHLVSHDVGLVTKQYNPTHVVCLWPKRNTLVYLYVNPFNGALCRHNRKGQFSPTRSKASFGRCDPWISGSVCVNNNMLPNTVLTPNVKCGKHKENTKNEILNDVVEYFVFSVP